MSTSDAVCSGGDRGREGERGGERGGEREGERGGEREGERGGEREGEREGLPLQTRLNNTRGKRAEETCTNRRQQDVSQSGALGHHGKEASRTDQKSSRSHTGLPLRTEGPLRTREEEEEEEEEEEGYRCGRGQKKSVRCKFTSFLSLRLPFKCKKRSDPPEPKKSDRKGPRPAEHTPAEPRRPAEPRPAEHTPAEPRRPAEHTPAEPRRPAEHTPAEPRSAEHTPAEPRPAEHTPAEPRPAEPRPAEHTPAEPRPAEHTPIEPRPAEHTPAEPRPVEHTPAEHTPAEPRPAEYTPAEPRPAEHTPAEPRPAEYTPAEPRAAEYTPAEPRPAGSRPEEPTGSGSTTQTVQENCGKRLSEADRDSPGAGISQQDNGGYLPPDPTVEPANPLSPLKKTSHPVPKEEEVVRLPTENGCLTADRDAGVPHERTPDSTSGQQRQITDAGEEQTPETTTVDTQPADPPPPVTVATGQRLEPATADRRRLEPTAADSQPTNPASVSASVASEFTDTDLADSGGSQGYLNTRHTKVATQNCSGATSSLAEPPPAMLSSTVVSVIAPHWSGRFRRHKKGLVGTATGEGEQDAQSSEQEVDGPGGVQERTSDAQNPPAGERGEIPGSQAHERAPSLGNSRGTMGWLDQRNPVAPVSPISSPVASPCTPASPLSLQLHTHRRMSQDGHRGNQPSSLSSKPTTSSILLSLRRFNSNWMTSNAGSTHSEATPPTLSSSTNDRAPDSHAPHPSPTSPNDREREQLESVLSSSSTAYRLLQTSREYPTQSYSAKQTILAGGLERLSSSEKPDLNRTPEVDLASSQTSQHGRLDFTRGRSLPRGTMLTSTSWWKHAEESNYSPCSALSPTNNNINNNINKNTNKDNVCLFAFPSSNKNDPGPHTTNGKASGSPQNINNINNNNLSQSVIPNQLPQSVTPNNLNHMLRDTQVKTCPLRRSETQDLPDQRSHTSLLTQPALSPADQQPQKSHSLSSISYSSKISSALSPVTFSSSSLDYRPCRSNVVDTAQFHLSSKSPESSTPASLTLPTNPQTSNTPASLYTSLDSRLPHSPHSSLHGASPGRTSVGQNYLPTSSKSPTPSSVLSSQRSAEKRTFTSRSFSLASYTPKPFSVDTSGARPISVKASVPQPLHPNPTSVFTKPPLPFKATPTPQPLSHTSISAIPSGLFLPQDNSLPRGERTFTDSLVCTPEKQCPLAEGRGVAGQATWHNSVDLQHSDTTTTRGRSGSSESAQTLTGPLSPSRPGRGAGGPSIFASLRSGSPSRAASPLSPSRTSGLQVWRGDRETRREREEPEGRKSERGERNVLSGDFDRSSRFTFNPQTAGRYAAPPSLPSDMSAGRKLPFSLPSYQSLKANSPPQGEVKCSTITPTSPHYKPPTLPPNSLPMSPPATPPKSLPISPPLSPYSPSLSSQKDTQQRTGSAQDSSKVVGAETDSVNNNYHTHVTVIETLVYKIPKASSDSGSAGRVTLAHSYTALQGPHTYTVTGSKSSTADLSLSSQHSRVTGRPGCQSQQSSNGDRWPPTEGRRGDSVPGLEGKSAIAPSQNQNQSSKGGLFVLKIEKESVVSSTHAAGLTRERETAQSDRDARETGRGQKETERGPSEMDKRQSGTTKLDLLSRLKQTMFNVKSSDDDLLSSRKWTSPTASDPSVAAEWSKQGEEERRRESEFSPNFSSGRWRRGERGGGGDEGSVWAGGLVGTEPGNRSADSKRSQFGVFRGEGVESRQRSLHSDLYEGDRLGGRGDGRLEGSQSRQLPPYRELSSAGLRSWTPNLPATLPTCRASSASPRSHNSPFSSLARKMSPSSPLSPFSSPDCQVSIASPSSPLSREEWESDSVFLSPVPTPTEGGRRRKAASLCEPVEEEAGGQGSEVRGRDGGRPASFSSCADVKYGLEAGRSFSVSSVLSSRPCGPRRISTGTRVASVNDLTELPDPAVTRGGGGAWGEGDSMASRGDFRNMSKSKSLPRSLLRSSNWGSEVAARPRSSLEFSHFLWDTEGPLTPPPSPPWSPASRQMSRAPSSSLSPSPPSAGSRVFQDSQTSRGRLPTRGYFTSLSAFDESGQDQDQDSDASSDTTTDDEYCLGGEGDEEEKETEL